MADITANFYTTTSEKLSSLPVTNGQIIFCPDLKTLFVDLNGVRVSYSGIIQLNKDSDRNNISADMVNQLYYIQETDIIWKRKSDGWKQVTPANSQPILIGTYNSFPAIGDSTTLYVSDGAVYRWDKANNIYTLVSNITQWSNIKEG